MDERKLSWIERYIKLNQGREGKKVIVNDYGVERCDSVVMDCNSCGIKVAINCGSYVSIKELCVLEGNKEYHIGSDYFNMSKFDS